MKAILALLVAAAGAAGQTVEPSPSPEPAPWKCEWVRSPEGDSGVLIYRSTSPDPKRSIIGFWISESAGAVQNAPQDVPTDNARSYQTNAIAPPSGLTVSMEEPRKLISALSESLEWFVEQEERETLTTVPLSEAARRPAPAVRAKKVKEARKLLRTVQSYLGDRL